jgi:hypothetical protein
MRDVYTIRRDNLRELARTWGGPTSLSRKLGHSNGSYLAQLMGPHPSRSVSEKVAREIERTLGLSLGWLDSEQTPSIARLDDETLGACVRAVGAALRDAGHKPDPIRYGTLVELVYDRWRLTGRLDEQFLNKLMELVT